MMVRVGVVGVSPGWQLLLQQEGVPFTLLMEPDELVRDTFSAIVLHRKVSREWDEAIRIFIERGGGLLSVAEPYLHIFGGRGKRRSIRYIVPHDDRLFSGVGVTDLAVRGTIVEGSQWCYANSKMPSIFIERVGEGMIAVIPVDFGVVSLDARVHRKAFYMKNDRFPAERVSLVSKGEIRKIIHHLLRTLHIERGIPYCHFWYFPDGVHNALAIRVDTDNGTEEEVESLYRLGEEKKIRMSWFLHVEAHRQWLAKFSDMKGHEIGVHCYTHRVATRQDTEKAMRELHHIGFKLEGFAAPYGVWSVDIGRAAEELGFSYSSEFSFDYDNVPSFPLIDGRWSNVLQVPVHPICIGSFRRCRATKEKMSEYFDHIIDWKLASREPLFFYHHPKDGHLDVLGQIISRARQENLPNLLFSEYASWWKRRIGWDIAIEISDQTVHLKGEWDPDARLRIIRDNEEAIVILDHTILLSNLHWEQPFTAQRVPPDITRIREFSPRLLFEAVQTSWRRRFQ